MKRVICLLLAVISVFAFTACQKQDTPQNSADKSESTPEINSKTDAVKGKTLVVYFSATGSTKRAAQFIAGETGADMFEITPEQQYTSDDLNYNDKSSRVCREHDDVSLRDIKLKDSTPANWDEYDTVFIGYPIWWGEAAWAVSSFVKENNFTGKTVIPFCTSASSELGDSAKNLAANTDSGNWTDGKRFASGAEETEVKSWAKETIQNFSK